MDNLTYWTQTTLIKRGWTVTKIKSLLGEPDRRDPNPHHPHAFSIKRYESGRVLEAEKRPEFHK